MGRSITSKLVDSKNRAELFISAVRPLGREITKGTQGEER
jgi:hypothetical protein